MKALTLFLSAVAVLLAYQNCSNRFQARQGQAISSRSPSSLTPVDVSTSLLPQKIGTWEIYWSDEFEGPANQTLSAPWHYFRGFGSPFWREAQLTDRHAYLDGEGHLKMDVVVENNSPQTSFIRTWDMHGQTNALFEQDPSEVVILDPSQGPIYLEASINLGQAYQSEDAWFAFWLLGTDSYDENSNALWDGFAPETPVLEPYDNNANTGMEIDILEYVPYANYNGSQSTFPARNGMNIALHRSLDADGSGKNSPDFWMDLNQQFPEANIDLSDGNFHLFGMYWDTQSYEFYVDGLKVWEVQDPTWITKIRTNSIILSWEVQNGTWLDSTDTRFVDTNRNTPLSALIDHVRVFHLR